MQRIIHISQALTSQKKAQNLPEEIYREIERQKLLPNASQILEDQRRLMEEWISKADLSGLEFGTYFLGEIYPYRKKVVQFVKENKDISSFKEFNYDVRNEARWDINKILVKIMKKFPFSIEDYDKQYWLQLAVFDSMGIHTASIATKVAVNLFLYAKTLMVLGSDYHKQYAQRAFEGKDFGCFALTEIAHGSNVQGCITTAKYVEEGEYFVLNTPHERGLKYWIGNAAQTANMAIVFANLIVKGKDYGVHCFLVEIRDHDHAPMPGITIADCGDKLGLKAVDNGMLSFRSVRIPRESLLDRVTKVEKNGEVHSIFEKKGKRFAVQLAALSDGRVKCSIAGISFGLTNLAIAARYTAVRRQLSKERFIDEKIMLDYPSIQNILIPVYSKLIIGFFSARQIANLWNEKYKEVFNPKMKEVKEMHALISILKPLITWWLIDSSYAALTVTQYLGLTSEAGLVDRITSCNVQTTWEGDNNILLQQTARFVLNGLNNLLKESSNSFETLSYLKIKDYDEEKLSPDADLTNIEVRRTILEYRAGKAAMDGALFIQSKMGIENSAFDAWNDTIPFECNNLSRFYGELHFHREGEKAVINCPNEKNKEFLSKLLTIYDLTIIKERPEYLLNYMTEEHIVKIEEILLKLYEEVKYNVVYSFNCLEIDDLVMNSTIGSQDGNLYERVMSKINADGRNFGRPSFWRDIIKVRKDADLKEYERKFI